MALNKVEQIIVAARAVVTGLATTGSNVERGKVNPFTSASLPALTIGQGALIPMDPDLETMSFADWDLELIVNAYVEETSTTIETKLNLIMKEVYAAIMASQTFGLSFVVMTLPLGIEEPVLSGEGNQDTGSVSMKFVVRFRSNIDDLSL